jgi:hypothetical protein
VMAELFDAIKAATPDGYETSEDRVFPYTDADGRNVGFAARYDATVATITAGRRRKTFLQFSFEDARLVPKAMPAPRPLYRLDELMARPGAPVLLVEGEGKANAAAKIFPDMAVVTSSGGSKATAKTDWGPLKSREVTIWPDHDEAGAGYAKAVLELLPHARLVRVPEDWPSKWDLADPAPEGLVDDDLREMITNAGNGAAAEALPPPRTTSSISGNGKAPLSQNALARKAEAKRLADRYCNKDGTPLTEEQLKEHVADLDDVAYERTRRDIATGTGVRAPVLDRIRTTARADRGAGAAALVVIEPWPEPVDADALLEEIVVEARRYLVLPEGGAEALALWVLFTHAHDSFYISPLLAFLSPTPEAGKTTAFTLLKALTPKALGASNITPAALFRTAEKWKPTLLVDELDSFLKVSDELRGVLNAGHHRGEAIIRCVGESLEPQRFEIWCPKALAAIGRLPPTLASRSIVINMRRKMISEMTKELRPERADATLLPLKRQAMCWAGDNAEALKDADPTMPATLYGRAADNWRPLIAIGDTAGISWGERARDVAVLLGGRRDETLGVLLLECIHKLFTAGNDDLFPDGNLDRLTSKAIADGLGEMEGTPWPEFHHGKPITANQVAKLLRPFGITPGTIRLKTSTGTPKGYYLSAFTDAFKRYLSFDKRDDFAATPPHD